MVLALLAASLLAQANSPYPPQNRLATATQASGGFSYPPGVFLEVCPGGNCNLNSSGVLVGAQNETLPFARSSAWTCPNDDGSVYPLLSGLECMPQATGIPTTNYLEFSNSIGTSPWSVGNGGCTAPVVTQNTLDTAAPDGSFTATKIVFSACSGAGNFGNIAQLISTTATNWINSAYVKTLSGTCSQYLFWTVNGGGTLHSTLVTANNSWSRVSNAATLTATSWYTALGSSLIVGTDQVATSGCTLYVWGAQAENTAGSTPTALVKTTSAPAMGNFNNPYGVRVRQAVTNIAQEYNAFATSPWSKDAQVCTTPTVTNNSTDVLAPDGTQTASKLAFNSCSGSGNYEEVFQTQGVSAANRIASVYLRTLSGTCAINFYESTTAACISSPISVGPTWQRYSLSGTLTNANWSMSLGTSMVTIQACGQSGIPVSCNVYAWGAQWEQTAGTVPSDVCPTVGASATCTAETLSGPSMPDSPTLCMSGAVTVPSVLGSSQYALSFEKDGSNRWYNVWATSAGKVEVGKEIAGTFYDLTTTISSSTNPGTKIKLKYDGTTLTACQASSCQTSAQSIPLLTGSLFPRIGWGAGGGQLDGTVSNIVFGSSANSCN